MGSMASQITSLTIVYSTVYSGSDQRKHQSSASLAFCQGIHRGPVNSPHKWPVTRKMFPFDDVIMRVRYGVSIVDPASDWYSASVPVIIYAISYNTGPCYNGTQDIFQLPNPNQCWEMIENAITFSCFLGQCTFYKHGLSLAPAHISKHMPNKKWNKITHPFPKFNSSTWSFGNG